MLLDIIRSGNDIKEILALTLLTVPMILLALCIHEMCHGWAAYLCGDSTAKAHGRLSLNPLKHLDPIGTLCMLLVGFGWAKPVPIVTRNFKKPRRDLFIVALAGPLSNFVLAFVLTPIYVLCSKFCIQLMLGNSEFARPMEMLCTMLLYGILVSIGLGLFNLIPIPPLDGSNMLMTALPPKLAMRYSRIGYYSRYIFIGVIVLTYLGVDVFFPLAWIRSSIFELFMRAFAFMW